jgi:hypothetical protein
VGRGVRRVEVPSGHQGGRTEATPKYCEFFHSGHLKLSFERWTFACQLVAKKKRALLERASPSLSVVPMLAWHRGRGAWLWGRCYLHSLIGPMPISLLGPHQVKAGIVQSTALQVQSAGAPAMVQTEVAVH